MLTGPAWVTAGAFPTAADDDRAEQMRSWPVNMVVAFAKARDLAGPSALLFASSVSGADLLAASHRVLVADVRLSSFAATKILLARDAFLQGS